MLCALRQHNTPSFQASALGRVLCLMQHFVMRSPVSGDRRHKVSIKATLRERGQLVKKEITSLTHLTPAFLLSAPQGHMIQQ